LLYAAYNRGSKAGGYTLPDDPPFAGNEASFTRNLPYDSETLHSFEVGAKLSLAPRTTLNATAFYYIYNNYQAQSIVGTDHSIFNNDARVKGVEVEFTTQPIDNLTIQFSGSYLDTKVLDVQLPDGSFTEPNLPPAPRVSGNAMIRYDFDLGPNSAYVQADGLYSGKSCYTVLCAPVEREGAYALLNGRIGVNLDNGLELRAFVENITNTKYRLYAVDTAAISGTVISGYAMPRVWGIGATYRFGGR
jgi:iron complex outermembrane receptor protein